MKTRRFFRKLYIPPLLKAGNYRAIRIATGEQGAQASREHLAKRSPELRQKIARIAGQARAASLTSAERSRMGRWRDDRKLVTPERRREIAATAARARWADKTPEDRGRAFAVAEAKRIEKRIAAWPFPHGPKMTRAQAGELGRIRIIKNARLRRFLARGKQ